MHGSAYAFEGGFGAHVNSETLRGTYFREASWTRNFAKQKLRPMARSLCCLLTKVNHAQVAKFKPGKYVFNAIRENKVLTKNRNLQYMVCTKIARAGPNLLTHIYTPDQQFLYFILFLWLLTLLKLF